jgi:hypothetical protein
MEPNKDRESNVSDRVNLLMRSAGIKRKSNAISAEEEPEKKTKKEKKDKAEKKEAEKKSTKQAETVEVKVVNPASKKPKLAIVPAHAVSPLMATSSTRSPKSDQTPQPAAPILDAAAADLDRRPRYRCTAERQKEIERMLAAYVPTTNVWNISDVQRCMFAGLELQKETSVELSSVPRDLVAVEAHWRTFVPVLSSKQLLGPRTRSTDESWDGEKLEAGEKGSESDPKTPRDGEPTAMVQCIPLPKGSVRSCRAFLGNNMAIGPEIVFLNSPSPFFANPRNRMSINWDTLIAWPFPIPQPNFLSGNVDHAIGTLSPEDLCAALGATRQDMGKKAKKTRLSSSEHVDDDLDHCWTRSIPVLVDNEGLTIAPARFLSNTATTTRDVDYTKGSASPTRRPSTLTRTGLLSPSAPGEYPICHKVQIALVTGYGRALPEQHKPQNPIHIPFFDSGLQVLTLRSHDTSGTRSVQPAPAIRVLPGGYWDRESVHYDKHIDACLILAGVSHFQQQTGIDLSVCRAWVKISEVRYLRKGVVYARRNLTKGMDTTYIEVVTTFLCLDGARAARAFESAHDARPSGSTEKTNDIGKCFGWIGAPLYYRKVGTKGSSKATEKTENEKDSSSDEDDIRHNIRKGRKDPSETPSAMCPPEGVRCLVATPPPGMRWRIELTPLFALVSEDKRSFVGIFPGLTPTHRSAAEWETRFETLVFAHMLWDLIARDAAALVLASLSTLPSPIELIMKYEKEVGVDDDERRKSIFALGSQSVFDLDLSMALRLFQTRKRACIPKAILHQVLLRSGSFLSRKSIEDLCDQAIDIDPSSLAPLTRLDVIHNHVLLKHFGQDQFEDGKEEK